MTKSKNFGEFMKAVKEYAEAYNGLEQIQKGRIGEDKIFDFVPETGDQKTGLIGEAFVFEYLKRKECPNLEFGGAAQKGWDIKYLDTSNKEVFVQVKTVSAYAINGKTIKFDSNYENHLVSLNKQLIPDNIWTIQGCNEVKVKSVDGKKVIDSGTTGIKNISKDFKQYFPEIYG
jgi:hypothetical protein